MALIPQIVALESKLLSIIENLLMKPIVNENSLSIYIIFFKI